MLNNKKNICYFLISDGIGGAETVVKNLIKNLDKNKYVPFLVVNSEIKFFYEEILPEKNIYVIKNFYTKLGSSKLGSLFEKFFNIRKFILSKSVHHIKNFISKNKIVTLHAHLMYDLILMTKVQKETNILTIYTIHGFLNLKKDTKKYVLSNQEYLSYIEEICIVTTVSSDLNNFVKENYPSINVLDSAIVNGIETFTLNNLPFAHHSNNSNFKILYLGGTKLVKGIKTVIRMLELLRNMKEPLPFSFQILGPIDYNSVYYKKLLSLKDHLDIEILGYVDSPDHFNYIASTNLLIVPSMSEGMSLVTHEAFSIGIPVLGNKIPIFQKLLHPEALLDSINCHVSLLEKIDLLRVDTRLYDKVKQHSIEQKIHFWSEVLPEYEKLYAIDK